MLLRKPQQRILQSNALRDSLHPILEELKDEKGGFNIFRRYRISHLKAMGCPSELEHFWSGHAHTHVSERYNEPSREYRLDWAEKIGMGFKVLPAGSSKTPSVGVLGLPIRFRKTA